MRDLAVETGLPCRDPALLARLFRERVETLADPLDPGFGFDLIRLAVPMVEPLVPSQLQLQGGSLNDEAMANLVDTLSTRLGRRRFHPTVTPHPHFPAPAAPYLPPTAAPV